MSTKSRAYIRRCWLLAVAMVATWALSGCAQTAEEMAEAAAPAATTQTLQEMALPDNQRRLSEIMTVPGVEGSGRLFAMGLAEGFDRYLSRTMTPEDTQRFVSLYVEPIARQLNQAFLLEFLPQLRSFSARVLDDALAQTLSDQTLRRARIFAVTLTRAIIETMLDVLAEQMREKLGPALQKIIAEDIGVGIAEAIREQVGPALSEALDEDDFQEGLAAGSKTISKHAVIGFYEGAEEVRGRTDALGPLEIFRQTVYQSQETLDRVVWMLGIALFVLLVLLAALGAWLYRTTQRTEYLAEQTMKNEQAMREILQAIVRAEDDASPGSILDRIRELRDPDAADLLEQGPGTEDTEPPDST